MKKLISTLALLLVFATLLTSCGVNLAKADMSEYVSLADGVHTSVKVEIDRTNLYKETVRSAIYEALRGKAGENKTGDEAFSKYDSVALHTVIFNQKGEIVSSSLSVTLDSSDKATAFGESESISLGFGANRDVLADIESQLLDANDPKYVKNHLFTATIDSKTTVNTNSFLLVTYRATPMDSTTAVAQTSSPVILAGPLYAQNADNSNFEDGFEKDQYLAASYQALHELCTYKKSADDTEYPYAPKLNPTTAITITVKPTADKPADFVSGVVDASAITIYADISFDSSNDTKDESGKVTAKTYEEGKIYFTPRGMIYGDGKTYIDADNIVIYEADETEEDHDALEGKLDVIVLPVSVTPYPDMIEYDELNTEDEVNALRAKIKELLTKDSVTPVSDDIAELKAQYEKHVYDKLDKDLGYFAKADEAAKDKIWSEVVSKADVLKYPKQNIKNYVKDQEEILKYMYHYGEYPTIGYYYSWSVYQPSITKEGFKLSPKSVTSVPAAKTEKFDSWKDYAIESYEMKSYDEVYNKLYAEGEAREKEMMMTYYMAEKLGITIDDARYAELIKADAEAWIKTQKENYEKQYGYAPTITTEDYEETMGGKDNLRGAHLLKLVKDELFKITTENGGVTFKEVYADGKEVEK